MVVVTGAQKERALAITWPIVALALVVAVFLLGVLVLVPKDGPQGRTALIGILVGAVGGLTTWFQRKDAQEIRQLLRDATNVSRETSSRREMKRRP